MTLRWHVFLIGLTLSLLSWLAQAQAPGVRVAIVSSQTSAPYMDAAQALIRQLESQGVPRSSIQLYNPADLANMPEASLTTPKVWVALGTQASAAMGKSSLKAPVLSALVPRSGFERVLRETGRKLSPQFNAVYLDQPLQRQMALIRLALPRARHVGVLLGPDSWFRASALLAAAGANGLALRVARVEDDSVLFSALQSVLEDSSVLLAQADPLVFNGNSIQNILLTTIRANVPMVAFSPAYVRAGALLALYSTPVQAGTQAAHWVLEVLAMRSLPEQAVEPDDFEISVNEQVARVFGLSLDAPSLRLALKRQEQRP
ncbi:ABC transporter substrate binding protein [Rhodoferax sp.]|uniref:ABC transporter substrate-binding protein n=1 Tax=Rhodoferax sp. TaxID=50421 RepID=UPI00262D9BBD|nr:ABC transporter substrate binding protein [Rhodoferax sp.]MDD2919601.1 ABC transporter substrate binding protein [Rhodoferax sp.]